MSNKEAEYKDLFLAEALENCQELNRLFVDLEKDNQNQKVLNSIFRIAHTLKGNAMGMGYEAVAEMGHLLEDVFSEIKAKRITLDAELFNSLFRANDKMHELVKAISSGEKVVYLGIKTKLEVLLKNARQEAESPQMDEVAPEQQDIEEKEEDITFAEVVQVPVRKLDEMMNLVSQLIIERDHLALLSSQRGLGSELDRIKRISSELQYSVMNARMVQMGLLFNKFQRVVRDVASLEGKNVQLLLKGTEIEIDRNVLPVISNSLVHLVRNAVSHGIEHSADRAKTGKPVMGTLLLSARSERNHVVISISDDGKGIDPKAIRDKAVQKGMISKEVAQGLKDQESIAFIFEPGFSSAEKVTEVSGRGVGMDVVKRTVESIGGEVFVKSMIGEGTTVELVLPSSLAMKGALLFEVEGQEYGIPLSYTDSVLTVRRKELHKVAKGIMMTYRDQPVSAVFLKDLISLPELKSLDSKAILHRTLNSIKEDQAVIPAIVIAHSGRFTALLVDKLLYQKEIIEKALPSPIERTKLISGTTILGDGNVCMVIDAPAISDLLYKSRV